MAIPFEVFVFMNKSQMKNITESKWETWVVNTQIRSGKLRPTKAPILAEVSWLDYCRNVADT